MRRIEDRAFAFFVVLLLFFGAWAHASQEISFDARKSLHAQSYRWDFGDGTSSSEPFVRHRYENPGQYIVTLTAKNLCGESVAQKTVVAS